MEEAPFRLPLVDFSSFASLVDPSSAGGPTPEQQRTAEEIHAANRKHGFVCLRNSGIPKERAKLAFAASQELFAASASEKANWKAIDPSTNTGYVGCGAEALNRRRAADLKEAFNVRATSFTDSSKDLSGTPQSFQTVAPELWEDLNGLAQKYSVACSWALGLEPSYFTKTLQTMDLCTMRWLHYPPCSPTEVTGETKFSEEGCAIRVGEHTDFGIFTFLFVHDWDDSSSLGLQIKKPPTSGQEPFWESIVMDKETLRILSQDATAPLIVNTGALLARWTNDLWTATPHRVVVPIEAQPFDRYSIAMFIDPDAQTVCSVHESFIAEGEEPKYPPITSIEYLLMKLREAQGVK